MTKDTDGCSVTYSNCPTYGVERRPRIPTGALSLIQTVRPTRWTNDQEYRREPGNLFILSYL